MTDEYFCYKELGKIYKIIETSNSTAKEKPNENVIEQMIINSIKQGNIKNL